MNLPTTTAQVFDLAIDIERKAAAFYAQLALMFEHAPSASEFWHQLYSEEIEHEAILTEVRDRLSPESLSQAPERTLAIQVADAGRWIDRMATDDITTLDDAYELAHDLEFSEMNAVFKVLAMAAVPADTQHRFVVAHVEQHQSSLLEFGHAHGGRQGRRNIKARRRPAP